ncbi:MAG TPA: hypothetical protein VK619_07675 [Pyrinomonadaceae bacterium]|nr:hypothetical protein [Pyrinomonadaceae bacterium]
MPDLVRKQESENRKGAVRYEQPLSNFLPELEQSSIECRDYFITAYKKYAKEAEEDFKSEISNALNFFGVISVCFVSSMVNAAFHALN